MNSNSYFFHEIDENNLCQHHKISVRQHKLLRNLSLVWSLAMTIYIIIVTILFQGLSNLSQLTRYVENWSGWLVTLYFIFQHLFERVNPRSLRWKLTYILGEVAFCFEFCNFILYWTTVFPYKRDLTFEDWVASIGNNAIISICIFAEFYVTPFRFPQRHRIFLLIFGVSYWVNNYLWTRFTGKSVHQYENWESWETSFYFSLFIILILVAFEIGRWHFKQKYKFCVEKTSQEQLRLVIENHFQD